MGRKGFAFVVSAAVFAALSAFAAERPVRDVRIRNVRATEVVRPDRVKNVDIQK